MKLSFIAEHIGATLQGSDKEITAMHTLHEATESMCSFIMDEKYRSELMQSKAGAIICEEKFVADLPANCSALVVENNTHLAMARATQLFAPPLYFEEGAANIARSAHVSRDATVLPNTHIESDVTIFPGAVIGNNVRIGKRTVIHANVTIYRDCVIGDDVIIQSGAVIGSDGFGFAHTKEGKHIKIYHNGNVIVEDGVEIGANCTIDAAVFGSTVIKAGVKLDNLVHIAHNCEVGEYSLMVAQSGIAGSTKLGHHCVVGGQSAFAGHLEVAPLNTFAARSGVTHSIKESGKTYGGFPLMEQRTWLKLQAKIARLLKR